MQQFNTKPAKAKKRAAKEAEEKAAEQEAVISHVLHPFTGDDKQLIDEAVKKMADALELWLKEGGDLDKVMQQFNTKPAKAKKNETATCALQKSVIL